MAYMECLGILGTKLWVGSWLLSFSHEKELLPHFPDTPWDWKICHIPLHSFSTSHPIPVVVQSVSLSVVSGFRDRSPSGPSDLRPSSEAPQLPQLPVFSSEGRRGAERRPKTGSEVGHTLLRKDCLFLSEEGGLGY